MMPFDPTAIEVNILWLSFYLATEVSYSSSSSEQAMLYKAAALYLLRPSNAETTFIQSTRITKIFENHLNPVMLEFIG